MRRCQMGFLEWARLPSGQIVKHLAKMPFYFAEKQLLAILRRKHDVVLALPGRVIKVIELCFHHGLLEGSWRFPKETSRLHSRTSKTSCFRPAIYVGFAWFFTTKPFRSGGAPTPTKV